MEGRLFESIESEEEKKNTEEKSTEHKVLGDTDVCA